MDIRPGSDAVFDRDSYRVHGKCHGNITAYLKKNNSEFLIRIFKPVKDALLYQVFDM